MKNTCVCLTSIVVLNLNKKSVINHEMGPNLSKLPEKLHFNPVSFLLYCSVLNNTYLCVGLDPFVHLSRHVVLQLMHYFWHIIKEKLGSDYGAPRDTHWRYMVHPH